MPAPIPPSPFSRAPLFRRTLFWLFILAGVPLLLTMFLKGDAARIQELPASQFEKLLSEGCIESVTMKERSSRVQELSGEFWESAQEKQLTATPKRRYVTRILYSEYIDQMLRQNCPKRDIHVDSRFWGTLFSYIFPFLIFGFFFWFFIGRQMGGGAAAMQFGKSRARLMMPGKEKITLNDVAGCDEAKEEMREIVDYLKDPKKFSRLGGRTPKGILMVGQPGTGKTLMAKAIAGEANVPFFTISGSDFVEMFVGVGASRVRDMFTDAKRHAPCLIFIDEIDAVGRSRFSGIGGGHDEREQTLNAMLVEMDGFEENAGVIVLAATNRPDVLDPALLRPGRFDRQVVIDLPDMNGRYEILKVHAKKVKLAKDVDLHVIARGTPGFAGADLANLLNEAAILATRRNREDIGMAELEESRDKVCWGKERRSRRLTQKTRKLTAYHEAGHTLVAMYLKNTEPLHKVTIIPRGMAMGATMYLPQNDRYGITYNQCIDSMAMAMGGRIAEKLIFQDVSSGASMDLAQATETARRMVCEWGMDSEVGPVSFQHRQVNPFNHEHSVGGLDCSPETAREIDLAVRTLTGNALKTAEDILSAHLDQLKLLAETLLEREAMAAQEVYDLLGMTMPETPEDERLPEDQPPMDGPQEAQSQQPSAPAAESAVESTETAAAGSAAAVEKQPAPEDDSASHEV